MHACQSAYREALETALPGVSIDEYDLHVDERSGQAMLWLKLLAPENLLVGHGIVTPALLQSVRPGSTGTREGLRITRRKNWTRIYACLIDGRFGRDDGQAAAHFEERVLTAFRSVWWAGPKPRPMPTN